MNSSQTRWSSPRVEDVPRFTSSPYEPELPGVQSLDQINLLDRDLFHRGDPHAAWRLLREHAPVFWHAKGSPGTEDKGFWVLSRYDDMLKPYRDSNVFSSEWGAFLDLGADTMPQKMLASIDGNKHTMSRNVVAKFFTPGALKKWESSISSTVTRLLDKAAETETCDFVTDIAGKLPVVATCDLLGIASDEAAILVKTLASANPDSPETLQKFNDATLAFFDAVASHRRNTQAQDSIVGIVANARNDGELLARDDVSHLLWNLFFGGIDSTTHAATGALLALFHHPDQLDYLRKLPGFPPNALEEMFRWTSISHVNKRKVLKDVDIRGTPVKKGDYVSMWSPSANRDESAFEDPYRFDLRRIMKRPIMTFGGGGAHQCLGQFFARLEMRVLFSQLIKRFPNLRQAGPAVRARQFSIGTSAYQSLPLNLRPV